MSPARILIVEDEALLAADLGDRLGDAGYEVVGLVSSGERALRQVSAECPDLVLMDIQLKGEMDGVETARRLHEEHGTPVIFLTAYADEELIERAKSSEPFGYLVKPIQARELHSTIEMALYKAEMEAERRRLTVELERALAEIKTLRGFIPICAECKSIRDDEGYWNDVETYLQRHSEAKFSHGICPVCAKKLYGVELPDGGKRRRD